MRPKLLSLYFLLLLGCALQAQEIANYVRNGSFEEKSSSCNPPVTLEKANYWLSIDSVSYAGTYQHYCLNSVPLNGNAFQFPKSGSAYVIVTIYDKSYQTRGYPKNRLKANLIAGKTYCVKFHVNITNMSPRGIDRFGAYFGDDTIDTISKCTLPITYLTPQVSNPQGNVITDTLNWVPITGTFVATGNEKYLLLGNFYSDLATTTTSLNSPYYPEEWTDVCIDDVSCIEMDVAAYAGPDKWIAPGDSVYLGRELDFAIDPYCVWYKLPNLTTAIDTASGIWVKPTSTSTYVVRQELECNTVKWDTVVVYEDAVGNDELGMLNEELRISPNPAHDKITVSLAQEVVSDFFSVCAIYNVQGELVKQMDLQPGSTSFEIPVTDLAEGLYVLCLRDKEGMKVVRSRVAVQR